MEAISQAGDSRVADIGTIQEGKQIEDTKLGMLDAVPVSGNDTLTHGIRVRSSFQRSLRSYSDALVFLTPNWYVDI